ncbi:sulfotransferase [Luminiphilus sp.]|nr:sulfotransferase [Luminiphilus sp.]
MIFIVGNSRSGTTLLGRMLNQHSKIHTLEELHFFEQMVDANATVKREVWTKKKSLNAIQRLLTSARANVFASVQSGEYNEECEAILKNAPKADIISVYEETLAYLTTEAGKRMPCEQTPRYLYVSDEILATMPEAIMISMVRDPRAVLASQKNKWKRYGIARDRMPLFWAIRAWINYHPVTMSLMWASASRQARRLKHHPRSIVIKYEDLLTNTEHELHRICKLAGVSFERAMKEVALIGSSTASDKPDEFGVDTSRIYAWQDGSLSAAELSICERVLQTELEYWGYKKISTPLPAHQHISFFLSFIFKSSAALLLNFGRFKSLAETIRRRVLS